MAEYQHFAQGERLKKIRKKMYATREEWANELNLTVGGYGEFETGRANFSINLLKMLALKGVNLYWLLTGEGEEDSIVDNIRIDLNQLDELKERVKVLEAENEAYKILLKKYL